MATKIPHAHKKGLKLEAHQVILRPLVTEKGTHMSTHHDAFQFEVSQLATKAEIKAAAEELFGCHVKSVNTQNRLGKSRRFRFRMGKLANWKKAIITLHEDSPPIEFF
jgi:large subunit ribosomal protein L23